MLPNGVFVLFPKGVLKFIPENVAICLYHLLYVYWVDSQINNSGNRKSESFNSNMLWGQLRLYSTLIRKSLQDRKDTKNNLNYMLFTHEKIKNKKYILMKINKEIFILVKNIE